MNNPFTRVGRRRPSPARWAGLTAVAIGLTVVVTAGRAAEKQAADQAAASPTMSWLDNGRVRLGVDLSVGGAVTFLADARDGRNMVNSYDWGRQIQMSFYGGPVPFIPPGATVHPRWKQLGWNPIQSGDCFGNRSRVVAHHNDGRELYVKCVPMHWPLKNVPAQCTYECWFTLDGPTVQARCRLTNHRPDKTQYPGRNQELPAVYTNGPWYKLVSYLGDRPFTGAAPTVLVDRDDGKGWPWRQFYTAEHWAALLNRDDRGLGIYMPQSCTFSGGFAAGPKGAGGPRDNPTGYMTPRLVEILDHNIVYTYRYTLILGSLDEIRRYVYRQHGRPTVPQWRFQSDRQHWSYRGMTDTGWPIRNGLNVQWKTAGAALVGPRTFWHAGQAPRLYVQAAFTTPGRRLVVLFRPYGRLEESDWPAWGPGERPPRQPPGRVEVPITGDGRTRTLVIDLGGNEQYRGAMTQLLLLMPEPAGKARIHSIGFSPPGSR